MALDLRFVTTVLAQAGREAAYPSKTIRFIVPFFPGGTPDINARLIAEKLRVRFNQPVIVDNRPGANGSIGMGIAAKSPPDGHTMVSRPSAPGPSIRISTSWAMTCLPTSRRSSTSSRSPACSGASLAARSQRQGPDCAGPQAAGDLNYGASGIGGFGPSLRRALRIGRESEPPSSRTRARPRPSPT